MPFNVEIDEKIPNDAKIIMPISMEQRYHSGKYLEALIKFTEGRNVTLLIADALHAHNTGHMGKALKLGTVFLRKNSRCLADAISIHNAEEWELYKNQPVLKIMRWQVWTAIKASELIPAKNTLDAILSDSKNENGQLLLQKMNEVANTAGFARTVRSSIAYQKEENEVVLSFSEFDYFCYPIALNASMLEVLKQFKVSHRLPVLILQRFTECEPEYEKENGIAAPASFFQTPKSSMTKRHAKSLPIALRACLENLKYLLNSDEISPEHKAAYFHQLDLLKASLTLPTTKPQGSA